MGTIAQECKNLNDGTGMKALKLAVKNFRAFKDLAQKTLTAQAKNEAGLTAARTMMNHETESQEEQLRGEARMGVKYKTNGAAGSDNAKVWMVWATWPPNYEAAGGANAKVWMVWATWPPNCWRGGRPGVLQDNEMHRDAELAALGEKHVANLLRDQVGAG